MLYSRDYKYSGHVETFVSPYSGFYRLEAWGAQGGSVYSSYWKSTYTGGFGAYSTGNIFLHKGDVLYIVVGESGKADSSSYSYNGGGYTNTYPDCYTQIASGGGCTHIAQKAGTLKELKDSKESVLLVASGGGGAYTRMCDENADSGSLLGGNGGGVVGSSPIYKERGGYTTTIPTGGNQSRGGIATTLWHAQNIDSTTELYTGSFGQGGVFTYYYGGGGSGWYGGASGNGRAGAGGSSYISPLLQSYSKYRKHMTCYNCITSNIENEYTLSVSLNDTNAISDTAKSGDGHARITLIPIPRTCKIPFQKTRAWVPQR